MVAPPPHRAGRTDLPVIVVDDNRCVSSLNAAAQALIGLRADELIGRRLDELLPERDRHHAASLWWALATGGSLAGRLPVQPGNDAPILVEFLMIYDQWGHRHEVRILPAPDGPRREQRTLSTRELEVLTLAARGFTGAQIAEQLHLSESTVETHARRIVQALGAQNRVHAVALAIGRGLIDPPRS